MIVKLKQYIIEQERSINGEVISTRFGYAIAIKSHWWNKKPKYLRLLYGWQWSIMHDQNINVQLADNISEATAFREDGEMDYSSKSTAENVIQLLKEQPQRFILS